MGVQVEVFTGLMYDKLRNDSDSWMHSIPDMSKYVDNKVIHMVDLGADPEVLFNNTAYPIETVVQSDTDIPVSLDKYQTKNTPISSDEMYAISYDKMGGVVTKHAESLKEQFRSRGIHEIAPAANTDTSPIIETTGATDGATNARKKMTENDIIMLKQKMDEAGIPNNNRHLVLCPQHTAHILSFSEAFQRQYVDNREGTVLKLYGFSVHEQTAMPVYNDSNTKVAFGATAAPTTDRYASVAFYAPRMFKAMDDPTMYYKEAMINPENRQNVIGFTQYFKVRPIKTTEAIGAIVSPPVS